MIKIGLIGDIVGSVGRDMVKRHLQNIREKHALDLVVANAENASGGFGLSIKNANELFSHGIDVITGGNHSFDKQEIVALMRESRLDSSVESAINHSVDSAKSVDSSVIFMANSPRILRPLNFPKNTPGSGISLLEICGEKLAIINAMGHYGININVDNVFYALEQSVESLQNEGFGNIIIDFHGESSSEKRMAFCLLRGRISALFGTHTHIGSDDLQLDCGSFYVSDVGLCGAWDNIIGMDCKAPLQRATMGFSKLRFEVVQTKNSMFQMIILELENGVAVGASKIRILNDTILPPLGAIRLVN